MSKKFVIDLINCTEEECVEFAKKVENEDIEFSEIEKMFNYYKRKMKYDEADAIKLIKNISLTQFYVSLERTDYQTPCGRTLLKVARFY